MSNHVLLSDEAQYRRTRLIQDAERYRLIQLATSGRLRVRSYDRVLGRLGGALIVVGRRLQAHSNPDAGYTEPAFNFQRT